LFAVDDTQMLGNAKETFLHLVNRRRNMKRFAAVLFFIVSFVIPFQSSYAADQSVVLEMIVESADQGSAAAQFYLGEMFYYGKGTTQDYEEAIQWYTKAAEQGHAAAQSNLGVMYYIGEGVAQNFKEAVKWSRKAAEQGNHVAQSNLGIMYAKGQGIAQDYIKAHMWFNIAAAAGNENARRNRDTVARKMTAFQIGEAQKLASEWKPKE